MNFIALKTILAFSLILLFFGKVNAKEVFLESYSDTIRKKKVDWIATQDTILLKPICGDDGHTYINEEEALFYGVVQWTEGRCHNIKKVICGKSDEIWLTEVYLNGMSQHSSYTRSGYTDFSNVIFEIYHSEKNILKFKRNERSFPNDSFKVWIDFDADSQFDKDELIIDQKASEFQDKIEFTTPIDLKGDFITKMRVFLGPEDSDLKSGFITTGEVEDYTVMVGN